MQRLLLSTNAAVMLLLAGCDQVTQYRDQPGKVALLKEEVSTLSQQVIFLRDELATVKAQVSMLQAAKEKVEPGARAGVP